MGRGPDEVVRIIQRPAETRQRRGTDVHCTVGERHDWSSWIVKTFFGLQSNVFACFG
jgi:hypothetical protein